MKPGLPKPRVEIKVSVRDGMLGIGLNWERHNQDRLNLWLELRFWLGS